MEKETASSLCEGPCDITFQPCGHTAMCAECAEPVRWCPTCKVSCVLCHYKVIIMHCAYLSTVLNLAGQYIPISAEVSWCPAKHFTCPEYSVTHAPNPSSLSRHGPCDKVYIFYRCRPFFHLTFLTKYYKHMGTFFLLKNNVREKGLALGAPLSFSCTRYYNIPIMHWLPASRLFI